MRKHAPNKQTKGNIMIRTAFKFATVIAGFVLAGSSALHADSFGPSNSRPTVSAHDQKGPVVTHLADESTPATYNDPALVEKVVGTFRKVLGEENVVKREPVMGAEDFGRLGTAEPKVPIFMFRLGSVAPEKVAASKKPGGSALPSLHSALYLPEPKATIRTGVVSMTAAAIELLK